MTRWQTPVGKVESSLHNFTQSLSYFATRVVDNKCRILVNDVWACSFVDAAEPVKWQLLKQMAKNRVMISFQTRRRRSLQKQVHCPLCQLVLRVYRFILYSCSFHYRASAWLWQRRPSVRPSVCLSHPAPYQNDAC